VPPWIRERELRPLHLFDRLAVARAADDAAFASADHRGRWAPAAYRAALPMLDTSWALYTTASLDWRHPLHDRRVIEAALTTPGATLYQRGLAKPVLRAAGGDALPRLVRDRTGGAHFQRSLADAVDAAGGLRALLAGGPLESAGWLDVDAAVTAWETALAEPHPGQAHSHGAAAGMPRLVSLWPVIAANTWLAHSGVSF
jgi:asparagine synthase (glutamine-hydrolysing)